MKRAIVIEGGALRGIHTSGVLDALMKYDIFFRTLSVYLQVL